MLAASGYGEGALAQLRPGRRPNFGSVAIRPSFRPDPRNVSVISGGGMSAQQVVRSDCRGYITPQPDVVLNLQGDSPWFRVFVASSSDTTLVIQGPNGLQCNDDRFGTNPAIEGPFPRGRYSIWVGSYRAGETANATLSFTEIQSVHP
jgi:hypothetical protein